MDEMSMAGIELMTKELILLDMFSTLPNPRNLLLAELIDEYAIAREATRDQQPRLRDCFADAEGRN